MGLIKTALKTAVAVKVAHVVHDRIETRKQEQWVAQGHPAESFPGSFSGVTGAVGATVGTGGQGQPVGPAAPVAPGPMGDVIAQLRELASMKADGVLTEAEFEAQKQRVLAQQLTDRHLWRRHLP